MPSALEGRRIHIEGTVQGVGFRPWVYRAAQQTGITGRVRNDSTGVTIEAFGDHADLRRFLDALHNPPAAAQVDRVDLVDIEPQTMSKFEIVQSESGAGRRVSIPPDLATCDDCLAEIFDPTNRRYRYAFTNCTHCGPRFTIATDVPYDRAATTMAPFEMCADCRREYDDPTDRRFHAQPNACPTCGPQLALHAADGARIHVDDVVAVAARAINDGLIVALKGIGGFHLACDATSEDAVRVLRERKRRDEKPLAVMVRTVREASALGVIRPEEQRLLTSVERPIVLLRKREGSRIAPYVAPHNETIGVMLAYSPLHHLLLAEARRPLVMTSGNLSDEPIATRNDEAIRRLGGVADLLVLHDRDIQMRCDDSVASVIAGRGTILRRSRGYVPRAIATHRTFTRPVLACGALLKNTFCIAAGNQSWLGPHIGDLENVDAYDSYVAAIAQMERFLRLQPQVIAHDMHPDYLSTSYAQRRTGVHIAVQHHHAHVVSAMTEHRIDGPALGIAYDGTGYGGDGTMWGGELLVTQAASFHRAATFRCLPLVGGDRAVKEPWRLALALVGDACGWTLPPIVRHLLAEVPLTQFGAVHRLLSNGKATPLARGVGRYFDAFGALFLGRVHATFEGQIALEWNQVADPAVTRAYTFSVDERADYDEIDLRPATREALADYENGEPIGAIAAAFHNTLAAATALVVRRAVARFGAMPIVASGGCFQNARLAEGIRAALEPEHKVWLHETVPPGDGGIALGQAVIANAMLRTEN